MKQKPPKLTFEIEDNSRRVQSGRVKKISPPKAISKHDIYVNHHTPIMATFKKAEKLLNTSIDFVDLHGTAKSIPNTIRIANLLLEAMKGSVKADIRTGTVEVTDRDEEAKDQQDKHRAISLVNVRVSRVI
ncbi:unnamed protein product [Bursaphelenchus xylophilus]|uniref:(pine wood nematode) hypothetical protein n=1 Tax=Bursaphelenchus xylophilus TaxID=6326 RepID=A0A1I7S8F2_BURXY|nr:unnamed protein product [Bursaphelenchus xylophilus]CAG9121032.1 unnamed protein product [Bursaphelenchus xylophilus]